MKRAAACLLVLAGLAPLPAAGQPAPDLTRDAFFPTGFADDARMLECACGAGLVTLEHALSFSIVVPPGQPTLTVWLFDGDTGRLSPCVNPDKPGGSCTHWDEVDPVYGPRQLVYTLYRDPDATLDDTDAVVHWGGNDGNPFPPGGIPPIPPMADNGWTPVTIPVDHFSRNPGNGFHYFHLEMEFDGPCEEGGPGPFDDEVTANPFKVAVSWPASFDIPTAFSFDAALRGDLSSDPLDPNLPSDELFVVYPGLTSAALAVGAFLTEPTTYDGSWIFFRDIDPGTGDLAFYDGDWDRGTYDFEPHGPNVTIPSLLLLPGCEDTDDPDTPFDYSGFPQPIGQSLCCLGEGDNTPEYDALVPALSTGPPDDSNLDLFRRGEPGDPGRFGCPRYRLEAPDGMLFDNLDPSGNQEWERFRITTDSSVPVPAEADAYASSLAAGIWTMRAWGLDMGNLNFWFGACAVRHAPGELTCTKPIDVLTMIWDGPVEPVHVRAWKDEPGEILLYDSAAAGLPIDRGDEVTVTGWAPKEGNDVIWEVFDAPGPNTLGAFLGESTFHLSCSDPDMNGEEDCGKRQGDGKGKSGYLEEWIFEGMVDDDETLDCTAGGGGAPMLATLPACPPDSCTVEPQRDLEVKDDELKWKIKNTGDVPVMITRVEVGWPDAKGKLKKMELDGTFFDQQVDPPGYPPTIEVIDSGFAADDTKRKLDKGKEKDLKLKFTKKHKGGDYLLRVFFDDPFCVLEAEAGGAGDFDCKDNKPIDALTMIWNGGGPVHIRAWKDEPGDLLLYDSLAAGDPPLAAGDEVTVDGYAPKEGNDVVWEIFAFPSGTKLGESTFHLSCSDDDMNGPEDCGKPQGDGKGQSGHLDAWRLEGMQGTPNGFDCTP